MIKIDKPSSPKTSEIRGKNPEKGMYKHIFETEKVQTEFDSAKTTFKFNEPVYQQYKEELLTLQKGKCCYCERKISFKTVRTVEHFRPKSEYKIKPAAKPTRPGYYWLAYNWDNLLVACSDCNLNKLSHFPLIDESTRAKSHYYKVEDEEPYFINPAKENPNDHFTFREEYLAAISPRGHVTETLLQLNHYDLLEERRNIFADIKLLKESLDSGKLSTSLESELTIHLSKIKENAHPFSLMFRENFKS